MIAAWLYTPSRQEASGSSITEPLPGLECLSDAACSLAFAFS
jgi:hypothetical protein